MSPHGNLPSGAGTAIRVMLVDDHKTMLWGLEKLIEGTPEMCLVGSAGDADAALAMAAAMRPHVIVLDLDLGGSCSTDILPRLLADGATRALVLSGTRSQELLGKAVRAGARGALGKEAPAELLLQVIRKVHQGELWLEQTLLGSLLGELLAPKAPPPRNPEDARIASLTAKERKIVGMIIDGNGALNKDLAQRAFIAEHTLRNHLSSIYHKLGVSNRLELYVYATRHKICP
ncbi:response regulator transcription factor [Janthinobacterium sp. AD80]|uniref:response regulator n=1 Tax=Janthinobacterium sp. AD80 TaxID=1528773 RepID=UPI000CB34642|nr:response regulator transcription factor [Janthinobacterium sp. AD80]PMQ07611.1 Transcriptional regulatory protein DevR (DosR) [Janthinobacterium sp. AD80]